MKSSPDRETIVRTIRSVDALGFLATDSASQTCPICGRTLTRETVGGLTKRQGELIPFCDQISCFTAIEMGGLA
jgi:hypothetical protein